MLQQTPIFHKHAVKRSHLPVAVDEHSGPEKPSAQRKNPSTHQMGRGVIIRITVNQGS